MIDVGRFMQDGVGIKTQKYEVSVVQGYEISGTFTANGNIVFIATGTHKNISGDEWFGSSNYISPEDSWSKVSFVTGGYGYDVSITYISDKSFSYVVPSLTTSGIVIVSEID